VPDLTTLLQGGALAAIVGIIGGTIGTALWKNIQSAAIRQGYRRLRRSQGFRDLVVIVITLLPYIVAGAWLYVRDPRLALLMLAPILAGAILRHMGRKRGGLAHVLAILALAGAAFLWTRSPWGPGVVIGSAVFREAWAKVRGWK